MWKRNNILTDHHIVPRSKWGTNDNSNILRIKLLPHQAIHILHENKLIAEQLIRTLELSEKAMRPEVVERLVETLTQHDANDLDFWYKDTTHF